MSTFTAASEPNWITLQ